MEIGHGTPSWKKFVPGIDLIVIFWYDMDMEDEKLYYLRDLYKRQRALGLSSGKMWVIRQEKRGKLKFQRDSKGWRRISAKNIDDILKAYLPRGNGKWSWDGSLEAV